MKTFKFRGKSKKDGTWAYGDYVVAQVKHIKTWVKRPYILHIYGNGGMLYVCGRTLVLEDTVGRFTGLVDKFGKEVYEGDLLRFPAKNDYEKINYAIYEVFWHDNDCAANHIGWQMNRLHYQGALAGIDTGMITFLPKYVSQMEIVGNIYDNPELI